MGPDPVLTEISDFLMMPVIVVLQQLQIVRLISITHFLEFGGVWGLYSRVRDLKHTIRPEIAVVETSIIIFYSIFVSGVLRVITQRYVRAGSSHSIWSSQTLSLIHI